MNKVIAINLNGNAYQLEEAGYGALRAYLESASGQLASNPDKDEILADIEQAIADKFRALMGPHKTVVLEREVQSVIASMGPVEDASTPPGAGSAPEATPGPAPKPAGPTPRRLYRINDGAMIAGVCNGLAAYLDVDPAVVRLAFVILSFITAGATILAYFVLTLVIPAADTPAQQAAARRAPSTAQDFIRRAREGYYEGMRTWGDRQARREWKRKFRQEMRGWRRAFRNDLSGSASQWRQNWERYWAENPRPVGGLLFALPFILLLRALLAFALVFAVVSLVSTGTLFGLLLPSGLPLWAGIILLVVVYSFLVWPLRLLRHACYHYGFGGPRYVFPLLGPWDAALWLGSLVLLIWIANRYVPQAHQALVNLPPAVHHVADSIREWWGRR